LAAWAEDASMATPSLEIFTPSGKTAAISAIALLRASMDVRGFRLLFLSILLSLQ
jgi:hypothetical protein